MSFSQQIAYAKENGPNRNPFIKYLPANWEALEVIIHNEKIQKQWALENNYHYNEPKSWMLEILKEQILWYKPDIIYASTISTFPDYLIDEIKEKLDHPCLWVSYYGMKSENVKHDFRKFDLVLTGWNQCLEELKESKIPCKLFPQYVDDGIAKKVLNNTKKDIDFSFVGNISIGGEEFNQRREYIKLLIKHCGLKVWAPLLKENCSQREYYRLKYHAFFYDLFHHIKASRLSSLIPLMGFLNKYQNWSRRPNPSVYIHPKIAKSCNNPVYGADMYQLLRRSNLTFNSYTKIDAGNGKVPYVAGNIRLFEATGVGTCILTQYTDDLDFFFKSDEEVAVYRTSNEAISKAKYLLANDSERNRIASAGMKKTWGNHTASIRAKQFVEIIEEYI